MPRGVRRVSKSVAVSAPKWLLQIEELACVATDVLRNRAEELPTDALVAIVSKCAQESTSYRSLVPISEEAIDDGDGEEGGEAAEASKPGPKPAR